MIYLSQLLIEQDSTSDDPRTRMPDASKPEEITVEKAIEKIYNSGTQIFTVTFKKRDNTIRTMNARRGVTKHLAGGELGYVPHELGLISVWDVTKKGYRMINARGILSLRIGGKKYEVTQNPNNSSEPVV